MPIMKRIVCLANSRKLHGRCVAGIELVGGKPADWVRPISSREHEEVSEHERQYEDGTDPRVLDVIDVPLVEPRPKGYQRENWLLDPNSYWVKSGTVAWRDLPGLVFRLETLWIDNHSTYNGRNDKIPLAEATGVDSSLRLIKVDQMTLSVFKPGEAFGDPKRRVQGRFKHNGVGYGLWVTDPVYERRYLAMSDGDYEIGECFLTISLGEPHKGACYKLIAAIIEQNRGISS